MVVEDLTGEAVGDGRSRRPGVHRPTDRRSLAIAGPISSLDGVDLEDRDVDEDDGMHAGDRVAFDQQIAVRATALARTG